MNRLFAMILHQIGQRRLEGIEPSRLYLDRATRYTLTATPEYRANAHYGGDDEYIANLRVYVVRGGDAHLHVC